MKKSLIGRAVAVTLLILFILQGCSGDNSSRPVIPIPPFGYTPPAKHIILFVGDGMQMEHEIAASRYLYGTDFGLVWYTFPYQGYATTWDVNAYDAYAGYFGAPAYDANSFDPTIGYDPSWGGIAPYPIDVTGDPLYLNATATDSASSATAMATGHKTTSASIAWVGSAPLSTIAEKMRSSFGASIGVVSTVPFNHATPAAFVSHNPFRGNYDAIADEIVAVTKPDVVISGGHPLWNGGYIQATLPDLLKTSTEYVYVERQPGVDGGANLLAAAENLPDGMKLFGLFGGGGGMFDPAIPSDTPGAPGFAAGIEDPSLAEATEAALTVLSRDPYGFFVMIEQGDIDWANHGNNYMWMITSVRDLNEAVSAAIAFVNRPGDDLDWNNTLIIVTADHANSYMRLTDNPVSGAGDLPTQVGSTYPDGEVIYGSFGHTNEPVTVHAIGKGTSFFNRYEGRWYPGTKLIDDTMINSVMGKAARLPGY